MLWTRPWDFLTPQGVIQIRLWNSHLLILHVTKALSLSIGVSLYGKMEGN